MKDSKHISIQIAGQKPFGLDISPDAEQKMLKVEQNVNKIWAKWCDEFQYKSPQDILAMVTFQYARYYYDLLDSINESEKTVRDFEQMLDDILLDINK